MRRYRIFGVVAIMAAILAGLLILVWALHPQVALAANGEDGFIEREGVIVIQPSANRVVHSPEELAGILRQGGMDEEAIQRVLELERRIDEAHRQNLPLSEIQHLMEQWTQELFPAPEVPQVPMTPDEKGAIPQPLTWFIHPVGIYACCNRVREAWGMPGHRYFYAWFRATSGNLYVTSGYCPYNACTIIHRARGDTAWDYHAVALPNRWPYWHRAGCE